MSIKLTHKQVNYHRTASMKIRCGTCSMYRKTEPETCTLVQIPIRPNDVCDRFEPMKRQAQGD